MLARGQEQESGKILIDDIDGWLCASECLLWVIFISKRPSDRGP